MRAIQMTEFGGPEVLRPVDIPRPQPAPGEVPIRVTRAGINFADTHTRTNSYVQKATLPLVPGGEVAGVREDTVDEILAIADGVFVGTSLKRDGVTWNPVDPERAGRFMSAVHRVRATVPA